MQLIIHRGTKEIGGSCVELNDKNTRILFDLGLPLEDNIQPCDAKLDIKGLYLDDKPEIDAIFITHAHLDHFGLLEFVNPEIPIYLSKTTYKIIKNVYPLTSGKNLKDLNLKTIENPLKIGDFEIIPHEVDHSIAGSLAYEICYNGKKFLYTGDLRFHGRKSYLSENLTKIKNVDYLIMECSTLGRENQVQKTENDIVEDLTNAFNNKKLNLITFSAQNLDRFISVYKACLKTKKILVLDPYTCYILENFRDLSKNIPQFNWNNISVYFSPNSITNALAEDKTLYKYRSKKISFDEIKQNPTKYVIKDNFAITEKILSDFEPQKIQYIYSLWNGYLEKSSHIDILKPQLIHIHTSGHANIQSLKDFVHKISPKFIIPIHTEFPEQYEKLFENEVKLLNNNEILEVL